MPASLLAAVRGAEHHYIGHVRLDVGRAGAARVKRMIYPPGFHWAKDMKPITGTELCMHAHVGFLVHGEIHIEYADGCIVEHKAPHVIAIEPGHDGWVVGKEPVVMIEFDFEGDTVAKLGMPTRTDTKEAQSLKLKGESKLEVVSPLSTYFPTLSFAL